jgi:hypothetical protein
MVSLSMDFLRHDSDLHRKHSDHQRWRSGAEITISLVGLQDNGDHVIVNARKTARRQHRARQVIGADGPSRRDRSIYPDYPNIWLRAEISRHHEPACPDTFLFHPGLGHYT